MSETPKVGMGATLVIGSDCHPYTIVFVKSPKRIIVQEDRYERKDKNGPFTEMQEYEYFFRPDAPKVIFTLRKNGRWYQKGQPMGSPALSVGERRAYQDPCF